MDRVFISSLARGGMSEVRAAVREAVESLGMVPVMFETTGATDRASRSALTELVAGSDVVVLILGAEYGEPGRSGCSPTEDEFNAARDAGVPVLAIVQEGVEQEPQQAEFVDRVRGTWERGSFAPGFSTAGQAGLAAVRALSQWQNDTPVGERRQAIADRARLLAAGEGRGGMSSGGSRLRVVLVPVLDRPLLDALALEDQTLPDRLATIARASGLVPNAMALSAAGVDRDGDVRLTFNGGRGISELALRVGADGAIVAEGSVASSDAPVGMGGMVVHHDRVLDVLGQAMAFARRVWEEIDRQDRVGQVLALLAVPDAQYKAYVTEDPQGSVQLGGGLVGRGHMLLAPEEPLVVRRQDLERPDTLNRLRAELRRRFAADHGTNTF